MSGPELRPGSRRRVAVFALGIAASLFFIALALRRVELDQVAAEIGRVSLAILSLSLISKFVGFLLWTWRSSILLKPVGSYSFGQVLRSIFVAFIGNNILPMRMGELLRIHYLARQGGVPHSSCFAVLVLERLFDLLCLLVIFLCTLPLLTIDLPARGSLLLVGAGFTAAIGAVLLISRYPDRFIVLSRRVTDVFGPLASDFVATRAERFAQGLGGLSSTSRVLGVLLLSFGYWGAGLVSIQIWLWAFGLSTLPLYAPLVILSFISFGTMLPSSPGYVGTYHYFVITALGLFGIDPSRAASFAIVAHAMALVPFTVLGAPVVMSDVLVRREELERVSGAGEEDR